MAVGLLGNYDFMKILFICDWDYTLLWKKVAETMLERKIIDECSALIIGRLYYENLKNENHIFKKLFLLQDFVEDIPKNIDSVDDKIKKLEKKYNQHNIWKYFWADRSWIKSTHEEIKLRLIITFNFFENFLQKEMPDLIVTNAYASMPHLILNEVSNHKKIKIIRPLSTRLKDYYFLSETALENEKWLINFDKTKSLSKNRLKEVKKFLYDYRNNYEQPAYQEAQKHLYNFDIFYV